ncbi:hypothetical protein DN069_28160 [Streptacidiphilus pinicola]|uniref:Uncharacterized protein n=1 Tax=Streptacidiphilus pinicola TaxID=2219663 RepID=A0A2X0IFC6_9ACTN|nr:hypothetical protein [Streptacidiphilus pinicola]RAG82313.1 hypothetical protein DN069_28160 [Streptacidiphilus pinicola]
MYSLLLTGPLDRDDLRAALARPFAAAPNDVDVSAADDEDRDWETLVACTVEPVSGDVTWSLEVVCEADDRSLPDGPGLARVVAAALGQPVLCPAQPFPPSAYWLAAPGGLLTRARLYDVDDDTGEEGAPRHVIDAVGDPVPEMPQLRVAPQPEVIREHPMPTPVSDGLALPDPLPDGLRRARNELGAWESLVARMTTGWPPDCWYPAAYFREDLEVRDRLGLLLAGPGAELLLAALEEVDAAFRAATQEDGGASLAKALDLPRVNLALRGWWWQRAPQPLPWRDQPG